jgi:hypothetical protein
LIVLEQKNVEKSEFLRTLKIKTYPFKQGRDVKSEQHFHLVQEKTIDH